MRSITYWHPFIYSALLKLSYKGGYRKRYEAVSSFIKEGSSVVDVCCGDCRIYDYLKNKRVNYTGLDFNTCFVNWANNRGIPARQFNIYNDEIPRSDYVLMMGSLYQFFPRHGEVLEKLFKAASKYIVISEPVKNNAQSNSKTISFISKILNDPGDGIKSFRFDIDTFKNSCAPFRAYIVKELFVVKGIEYVVMLKKQH
jgi:hypothetical protein